MSTIKSFRGQIADNGIDTISLHTNDGSTGYRIKKFEIISQDVADSATEHIMQLFTIPQATASQFIDFSNQTLLGVSVTTSLNNMYAGQTKIIFDNMTFNQDIYLTHVDAAGAVPANYYIELEQISLALDENTVATLKDIRNIEGRNDSA
jgi:hypothetical protein